MSAQIRDPRLRQHLLNRGWSPPSSDALQKQAQELGMVPALRAPAQQVNAAFAQPQYMAVPGMPLMQNPQAVMADLQGVMEAPPVVQRFTTGQDSKWGGYVKESQELYHNLAFQMFEQDKRDMALELHNARFSNAAAVNRLPAEQYLRTTFIEGKVLQRVAPQLIFLDMATRFTTDSIDIVWFRHNFSPDTDPLGREPIPMGEDTLFPRVEQTDPVKKMGSVGMWGLAVDFTRRALMHTNTAVDDIQRKIDWAAWKFANKVNKIYGNVLTGNFNTSQTGNDAVITFQAALPWDDDLANPINDVRRLALKMKTEQGHYFRGTEIWMTPEQKFELDEYAQQTDHEWVLTPINTGELVQTIEGIQIREAPPNSGIPDGKMIMLAKNFDQGKFGQPLTVWEAVDPEFTKSGMLHVDKFRHPETKRTSILMWKEFFVANRNPKAVGLLHGA